MFRFLSSRHHPRIISSASNKRGDVYENSNQNYASNDNFSQMKQELDDMKQQVCRISLDLDLLTLDMCMHRLKWMKHSLKKAKAICTMAWIADMQAKATLSQLQVSSSSSFNVIAVIGIINDNQKHQNQHNHYHFHKFAFFLHSTSHFNLKCFHHFRRCARSAWTAIEIWHSCVGIRPASFVGTASKNAQFAGNLL